MDQATITLCLMLVIGILFIAEIIPLSVTALGGAILFGVLGIVPLKNTFVGFSANIVVLMGSMMVIGSALLYTGLAKKISTKILGLIGKSEGNILMVSMVVTCLFSACCSNLGIIVAMMPIVISMAQESNVPVSRQMMPLAYAAVLGGNLSIVGAGNVTTAVGLMEPLGLQTMGFFEIGLVGVPVAIANIIYMRIFATKLLPDHKELEASNAGMDKDDHPFDATKSIICAAVFIGVVIVMVLNLKSFPMHIASAIGALILIVTGCVSEKQAYKSISWMSLVVVAGSMTIAKAMEVSGAGKLAADTIFALLGTDVNAFLFVGVVFVVGLLLTQVMNNIPSVLLLTPICVPVAQQLGINGVAVVAAIIVATSSAYMTPVGAPTNMVVLEAGNYRFTDYLKFGSGMALISLIVGMTFISLIWL